MTINQHGSNGGWGTMAPGFQFNGYMPQQPAQVITNVEFVTSLEEALYKSNTRNSDMYYLDQNKPLMYRVKVDMGGVKSYVVLPYTLPDQASNAPATKADLQALTASLNEALERLDILEKGKTPLKKKKPEEVDGNESHG